MSSNGMSMKKTLEKSALRSAVRGLTAGGLGLFLLGSAAVITTAGAEQSSINLQSPSQTDTPGTTPSLPAVDQELGVKAMQVRNGAVVIDSAVLLKVYYYAFAKQPIDYSAILTGNTEMIDPPKPVEASANEKSQIDQMIAFAKSHPNIMIRVDDIALDPYVADGEYYPIDNRLFIHDVGYYFDNSPYHYVYQDPETFRHLHCTDPTAIKSINDSIANYVHFKMDIAGTVTGANARDKAVMITLRNVALKDALGNVLISQSGS